MKKREYVFFVLVLSAIIGLSISTWHQNKKRKVARLEIHFSKENPLFLTDTLVNKMLKQKKGLKADQYKDSLDLSMLELVVEKNPAVAETQAFSYPDGRLEIQVRERIPFLQVIGERSFFLDQEGHLFSFPTVTIDSLPVVEGEIKEAEIPLLLKLVKTIQADTYFKKNTLRLQKAKTGYVLTLSELPYKVVLGQAVKMTEKINKLKAFLAYQKIHAIDPLPKRVNLAFQGQVVATN